jgi:hypothetical protein
MRSTALAVLSVLASACSGSKPIGSDPPVAVQRAEMRGSSSAAPPAAAPAPVIAELRFRDHVLVIRPGAGEVRYDVQTPAGLLLASSLSRSELDRQFPAIAGQFSDSTALPIDATLGPTSDSAMRPAPRTLP